MFRDSIGKAKKKNNESKYQKFTQNFTQFSNISEDKLSKILRE